MRQALTMSAWTSESWKDEESDDRVEKCGCTYTREGGRGTRPGAEWEWYAACYCRCAAFLRHGQALVRL